MNEEDVNTLSEQHENKKTKTKAPYDLQILKEFLESYSVCAEHPSKFYSDRRLKIDVSDDSSQSQ